MERLGGGDPARIGTYRLIARLGTGSAGGTGGAEGGTGGAGGAGAEGGTGQVYLARSGRGRTVAVKLVRRELAGQDEFRDRFRREVAAARRVGGRWTAPVLDADTEAAVPWVAVGYVAGPSLRQVVGHDHGPLPERSLRVLAAGLAHALHDIHTAGIVHRGLKPSTVLVTIDGPRVIDFGVDRALETVTDGGLTDTGVLVGHPGFLAPEQVRGDRVTAAADVFCLGSVLAYAATGALPFDAAGSGAHAMMFRIAQEEPDLAGVPRGVLGLVRDCLRKDPADRPTPEQILIRTGVSADAVADGYERDTWLPGPLVAQLGRYAVRLLEVEEPEEPEEAEQSEEPGQSEGPGEPGEPGGTPEHAPPGEPPAHPAQGHPEPHPQHHPQHHPQPFASVPGNSQRPPAWPGDPALEEPAVSAAWSRTPDSASTPYVVGRADSAAPVRRFRLSMALSVAALVVALGAGASVVALLNGDDDTPAKPPAPTLGQSVPPRAGVVPSGFLGSWTALTDGSEGISTRRLTIVQGEVDDRVLTLVADGPTGDAGPYHCVFEADLAQRPTDETLLRIGPLRVVTSEPVGACVPGIPSTLTLLPDGRLRRVTEGNGERLTYRKES